MLVTIHAIQCFRWCHDNKFWWRRPGTL